MIEKVFIEQGLRKIEMEKFLKKELDRAGFTKAEIVKTPLVTRIVVNVTRPGLAIGKSGQTIRQLTEAIGKKFKIDNPQLEIKEIPVPQLNAQAVADSIKTTIEKGIPWRSAAYRAVSEIMNATAQGVELILSGKLAGKGGRKRRIRIAQGYLKKVGDQAKLVEYAKATAYPKPGAIGIKLRIVKPETLFPDKVVIADFLKKTGKITAETEKTVESEEKAEEEKVEGKEKAGEEKEKKQVKEDMKGEKKEEVKEEKSEKKENESTKEEVEVAKEKKEVKKEDEKGKVKEEKKTEEKTKVKDIEKKEEKSWKKETEIKEKQKEIKAENLKEKTKNDEKKE